MTMTPMETPNQKMNRLLREAQGLKDFGERVDRILRCYRDLPQEERELFVMVLATELVVSARHEQPLR